MNTASVNLSTWYLRALAQYRAGLRALPTPPFLLSCGLTVTGDRFYDDLELSVQTTIAYQQAAAMFPCPRFKTGALQSDLRKLYKYVREKMEATPC